MTANNSHIYNRMQNRIGADDGLNNVQIYNKELLYECTIIPIIYEFVKKKK